MAGVGENLTPEQTEKLIQFQDLTGIEEIQQCRQLLETHNWDIEIAVQDNFNEREGTPSVFAQSQPEPRTPPVDLQPTDQRVFMVQPRRPQGIVQWSYFMLSFPFRFVYTTLLDVLRFAFQLFRPDPRRNLMCLIAKSSSAAKHGTDNVTDPVGDVTRFIARFNDQYGTEHPVFYQGSYSQALNDAKRELRFLLVYLHGSDHQDTDNFCRGTLLGRDLINFIDTRMLFWGCDTNSPEGFRVSQALRERTYPFLALIVLRENKMTVVARIEGPIDGADLRQRLEAIVRDNEASIVTARAEREERSFNQSLRDQQDEDYLQSLKQDQEKERKKREEVEQEEAEEQRQREQVENHDRMLQDREDQKAILRDEIPEEPPSDSPDTVRIVLKLPDGTRVERRFLRTQSLKNLYYFAFCHEQCPDDFHIVTNFPRKTIPCQPTDDGHDPISFQEFGFGKNEMLFIQDNEA